MNIKNIVLLFIIAIIAEHSFTNMYDTHIELDLEEKIFVCNAPITMEANSDIYN